MDLKDCIHGNHLRELELAELAELCTNIAMNRSANHTQTDTAHVLRMEWIRLSLDHPSGDGKKDAVASLRERMLEFLSGVPAWMTSGL